MGNNQPSSGKKGHPIGAAPNLSWPNESKIRDNYDFVEFQLTRGGLVDEDDEPKGTDDTAADASKPTLKFFNATDFRSQRLVGEGSFGKVLEGYLHSTQVAVKMFHAPLVMEEARNEIGPLMGLKHRNLVKIKGILTTTNFLDAGVVAMECPQVILDYFPEGNLLQYLSKPEHPQDYAMLGKLALDVAHGCEYLHSRDIVHGNLAARNILVEKAMSKQKTHFNAKVGDYGTSRLVKGSGGNFFTLPSGKVVPIRWVPKELVLEDPAGTDFTFASDVWMFGVVLWEMWTKGAIPFGVSYTNMQVIDFLKSGKSPYSIHVPKGCPGHITNVMESIFKVNPNDRPKFRELKEAFEAFKLQAKAKQAKEKEHREQIKKESTAPEKAECKKDVDSSSVNQNQGKKKDSKAEVEGEGKPKKPGNTCNQQQYKQPDQLKSSNCNKQEGGQHQSQKHPHPAHPMSNRGRGGGGRAKQHARGPFSAGSSNQGKYSGRNPGAPPPPPPYTPNPLPNHAAYFGPTVGGPTPMPQMGYGIPPPAPGFGSHPDSNFDVEIKRRQEEIKLLQAQKVTGEIQRKTAELADAIHRGASIGINSAVGINPMNGPGMGGFGMPPPPQQMHVSTNKGGRGGTRGRGKPKQGHVSS